MKGHPVSKYFSCIKVDDVESHPGIYVALVKETPEGRLKRMVVFDEMAYEYLEDAIKVREFREAVEKEVRENLERPRIEVIEVLK